MSSLRALLCVALTAGSAAVVPAQDQGPEDLLTASEEGALERARALLDGGADPDTTGEWGQTPLMLASLAGELAIVQLLVEHGASMTARDADGDDALGYAVIGSATEVAAFLLERGADANASDDEGWTRPLLAAGNGDTAIARLLLDAGANLSDSGPAGTTALHEAAGSGAERMVILLLERGADIDARTPEGWTPWMTAVARFDTVLADTLAGRGARHDETLRGAVEGVVEAAGWATGWRIDHALAAIDLARAAVPNVPVTADVWSVVCWNGTIAGAAVRVADACEQAVRVRAAPSVRDRRGLNRAVRGDLAGAIEDFEAFLAAASDGEARAARETWLASLRAGENPITPEVLEELRYPWLSGSAIRAARRLGFDLLAMTPDESDLPDSAMIQTEAPTGTNAFSRAFTAGHESFGFAGARVRSLVFSVVLAGSEGIAIQALEQLRDLDSAAFAASVVPLLTQQMQLKVGSVAVRRLGPPELPESLVGWLVGFGPDTAAVTEAQASLTEFLDLYLAAFVRGRIVGTTLMIGALDQMSPAALARSAALFDGKVAAALGRERP